MGTKEKLLALLEAQRESGQALSGQDAAAQLGVSRAAIWKAAQALRAEGLRLDATPGGGYSIAPGNDFLSGEAVATALTAEATAAQPPSLRVLPVVDSTNMEAKRWAMEGAPHGALVVAARQTAGRGRLGRSFASPPGGLYLSVVLRPQGAGGTAGLVTSAAAVAVRQAVQRLCGIALGIKWVNDLYLNGKKCCGILSEAATGMESGGIEYMVVGVGVNLATPPEAFGPEVAAVATSLYPGGTAPVTRARLAAAVYTRLLALYDALPDTGFLEEYRTASIVLGRQVTVLANPPYQAQALAIDDEARLVVRRQNGACQTLGYGEISIGL